MSKKFPHYVALFGILGAAIFGFFLFPWDKDFQISLVVATGAAYAAWGVIHHYLHNDLYLETVVEYLGTAILGSALLITLLL